jgi:acyl-CoA synthetase (AMP-forming)/AMP-acid ligase II/alkylation response protein AidB-like acyl-CoA dehydrogenase/acyl carrier protein
MDALDGRSNGSGDRTAYTFLGDGDETPHEITFAQLRRRALSVARRLTALNARGERALLLYPQGLEFIVAFFGCLYAGVVAVPVSAPNRKRGVEALRRVALDCGAKWVLSTRGPLEEFAQALVALPDQALDYVETGYEDADESNAEGEPLEAVQPSERALLQYTSGSTGSPRGVVITHANLAANQEQVARSFGFDERTRIASWLPMFHDMGLGTMLVPVWNNATCVLMTPRSFLQEPRCWLQLISSRGVTAAGGPDFAYDLCVRRVAEAERAGLDLSAWRVAYTGSEPVRAATLQRFSAAFAACGFRREAFHPVYGLAEATLLASSEDIALPPLVQRFDEEALEQGIAREASTAKPTAGRELVSCGSAAYGTRMPIVDPHSGKECGPAQVGEIWIQGPHVAAGYWGQPEETAHTFGATTAIGEGPFLRTGDLGFFMNGHLFVTGRIKDLIIVRGRNHYPHDIEDSVSHCHPALVPYACAAFSVETARGEELVVVQEVARTALRSLDVADVVRAVRGAASEHHSLHTHAVVLLKPSTLPRTTSGKVRRKNCRQAYLNGSLPTFAAWVAPPAPTEELNAGPDSERVAGEARADRLIAWLRANAADLIQAHATHPRPLSEDPRAGASSSLLRDFAQQGLLGMQVSLEYGGLGLGQRDTGRVLEQLAAFDFALALFVALNNCLGIQPIAKYGKSTLKAWLLPGLAQGRELAAFALEEPGGTPPSGMAVTAHPAQSEDNWQLFGTKYLDAAGHRASVFNVFARHEEPPGISAFVVSDRLDGVRKVSDGMSLGVSGSARDTVALDGARVGRESLLGSLAAGLDIAHEAATHARLAIATACIGGMKRCAQIVSRGVPLPTGLNGKLTPNPVTLSRLGTVTTRIAALECLVYAVSRALDAGHAVPSEAFASCKILGPELLLACVNDATQIGVSGGYAEANRLSALHRDAGLLRNFDGPPETVAELIGETVMASDASLRAVIEEVLQAPELLHWITPVIEAVRQRMTRLDGALLPRAQRWGHTRAGELTTWLILLAAVEGVRNGVANAELTRTHTWARAQLEQALSAVRVGTPSETATLDSSEIALAFAAYARTIGEPRLQQRGAESAAAEPEIPLNVGAGSSSQRTSDATRRELRSWVTLWLARRLQIAVSQVETDRSFADHGLDSVAAVELAKAISDRLGRSLDETLLWNFSTIDLLVDYLVAAEQPPSPALAEVDGATPSTSSPEASSTELEDELALLERELRSRT